MSRLVIVESPAKAKTIEKFLGKDYSVKASFGHVRDLPQNADEIPAAAKKEKWARLGVNVDDNFAPLYVIPPDKLRHVKELKAAMKGATEILLATDPDREGEAISWHLIEVLKPKVPVRRVVFHEITKEAILEAVANPREVDQRLVSAQETRRILDRLYGYSLSPILWKKIQRGLSAGRVQSVAVRLLVLRERERMAFRSAAYWGVEAELATATGEVFPAELTQLDGKRIATGKDFDATTGKLTGKALLLDEKAARALVEAVTSKGALSVDAVERKPFTKRPAPPFSTSTLQQEANRKLGFAAKRTMQIAQRLYEGIDLSGERVGLITYMRTDSFSLSKQAMAQAQEMIRSLYGAEYTTGPRQYRTKSRSAQEAHEAIRPTSLKRTPQSLERVLDREQLKLYELIWKRTLASQMAEASLERTVATLSAPTERGAATFSARGQRILFPGFLRVYVEGSDDPLAALEDKDVLLPALKEGDRASVQSLTAAKHETAPPARYTEASLVKRLEEEGIGRPSTYATILGTIQERGYCRKTGNALVPTFTAFAVVELLERHFGDLVDLAFTAHLEEELDRIAEGTLDSRTELEEFYFGTAKAPGLSKRIETESAKIEFPAILLGVDPETKKTVVVKIGRFGAYVQRGDGEAPERGTVPETTAPAELTLEAAILLLGNSGPSGRVLGADPVSGKDVSVRVGRFGPYVQLGEMVEGQDPPKRANLRGVSAEEITLDQALGLLAFPRLLGTHPESGAEVMVYIGRYGPYVKSGETSRSLADSDSPDTVDLARALELFAAPPVRGFRRGGGGGAAQAPIASLGKDPVSGAAIVIKSGRFGPYATDGGVFASIPKDRDPAAVTLEEALELIAKKKAAGPSKKKGGFRRGAARAKPRAKSRK